MKTLINTGKMFDPLNPDPAHIALESLAQSLSFTCRYNGHCSRFYSVAEHSLLVSYILEAQGFDKGVQLAGLLHDAAEAYLGDIVRPIKHDPRIAEVFEPIERNVLSAIAIALRCDDLRSGEPSVIVRVADDLALEIERANLMPENDEWPRSRGWTGGVPMHLSGCFALYSSGLRRALEHLQDQSDGTPFKISDFCYRYHELAHHA